MKGRRPNPSRRKELEGNPGKRAKNHREPELPPVVPASLAAPEEMENSPLALREWSRLMPMLQDQRLVTEGDRAALVAVCLEWARYIEATQKIRALGMVVKAPSGYPMPNPYLSIATRALVGCTRLWAELGLTPSSRSRVQMADGPRAPADAFAEFDTAPTQH